MSQVGDQYERWIYPLPAQDLEEDYREGKFDRSDPSLFRRKLWPRPIEPENLRILIAGCGTMQAARYAYRNPQCDVVGVDISQSSLDHSNFLKEKHGLTNLRLHRLSLLDIEQLGERFDLVVSTGVLHHLPDPDAGLRKLKTVLLPHGVMSLMVYGLYRRFGVYMMQEAFRLLGVEQTEEGVGIVRETLEAVPAWHHVKAYASSAPDLNFDGGLVDTFLHTKDLAYTVKQLLQWASGNGLRFQDWMDRHCYSLGGLVPTDLLIYPSASRLNPEDQWQLVELLGQSLGTHGFLLCHPERDPATFTVDFSNPDNEAWLSYIPHLYPPFQVIHPADPERGTPAAFRRLIYEFTLEGREAALFERVNGKAPIAQIIQACSLQEEQLEENRKIAFGLFSRMHDRGHLMYQI